MPRSEEAEAFCWGVYAAVQEIPYGRVTTYGHIAALIGTRESSPFLLPSFPPYFPRPNALSMSTPLISMRHTRWDIANKRRNKKKTAQRPRQVGICLKHLPSSPTSSMPYHNENVPWQRVINAKGIISPRKDSPHLQHTLSMSSLPMPHKLSLTS
jgi:alkylated DNA nucleotide flippase Atl1